MEGLGEAATAASAGACVAELMVPYQCACAPRGALEHDAAAAAAIILQPAVLACCPGFEEMASPNQREAWPTSQGAPERSSPAGLVIKKQILAV